MPFQCSIGKRLLILFFILASLVPCVLWNVGIGRKFNKYAVDTQCVVENMHTEIEMCTYKCNCIYKCIGGGGPGNPDWPYCFSVCQECPTKCTYGYLTLTHNISDHELFVQNVSAGVVNASDFNKKYNLNGTITCYFYPYQPYELEIKLTDDSSYFELYLIWTIIAGILLVIWIALEVYDRHKSNDCFRHEQYSRIK